eukprot:g28491.t2
MACELCSSNPRAVVLVESAVHLTVAPGLVLRPGEGSFSMAADRSAVAEVLQSLIKRKLKLYLEEGQIHRYRFLWSQQRVRLSGFSLAPVEDIVPGGPTEALSKFLYQNGFARLGERDAAGWSPLCYAALGGNPVLIREMLQERADPNDRITKPAHFAIMPKNTPVLHVVSFLHHQEALELLLEFRANCTEGEEKERFIQHANLAYEWLVENLFEDSTGFVLDHIVENLEAAESGKRNPKGWTWSYNQATFVGASALKLRLGASTDFTVIRSRAERVMVNLQGPRFCEKGTCLVKREEKKPNDDAAGFKSMTGVSQWEKPESLMSESERLINADEWKQYRIWDGRIFYHNKETKVSCWSMPPELRKLKGEIACGPQEFLKEQGIDATWDWRKVQSLLPKAGPSAQSLSEGLQKQVFAELLSMELRKKELQARRKARNAAVALERLLEERFGEPDALGTSYQEAATILGDEEAWILIKSDVRREEVFQNVMERLEEKHQNARAEQRTVATLRERAEHVTESKQEAFRGPEPGPSQGSYGHPHLCRRPCVKFARGCCDKGVACGFCHSDHVKPATFDKQARDWLAAWPKGRVIAAVLPLLHRAAVKECSAMDTWVCDQQKLDFSFRSG